MAKRSNAPLTLRERQCRKVARGKAYRKWASAWRKRFALAGAGVLALAALTAAGWEWKSHGISNAYAAAEARVYATTARMGFLVRSTVIEGERRTPRADVEQALQVRLGSPILALSLDALRAQLERIPTVKHAHVQRELPSTLRVRLEEREPVAIWQHHGHLALIDDEGAVMRDLALADYSALPLVVGDGAPAHVTEALAVLEAEPALKPDVAALVRVGDRRWNVRINGSAAEIKLPEENAVSAWQRFAKLNRERHLLLLPLKSVDLRQPDRLYLRFMPGAQSNAPSKET